MSRATTSSLSSRSPAAIHPSTWSGEPAPTIAPVTAAFASVNAIASSPTPTPRLAARCVICEQLGDLPFRYMAYAQWEIARREERRTEHGRRGGFCPLHMAACLQMISHLAGRGELVRPWRAYDGLRI